MTPSGEPVDRKNLVTGLTSAEKVDRALDLITRPLKLPSGRA